MNLAASERVLGLDAFSTLRQTALLAGVRSKGGVRASACVAKRALQQRSQERHEGHGAGPIMPLYRRERRQPGRSTAERTFCTASNLCCARWSSAAAPLHASLRDWFSTGRERYNSQYALPPFLPARPISCSRSDSLGGTYAEVAAVGGTHFSLLGLMGMVARW